MFSFFFSFLFSFSSVGLFARIFLRHTALKPLCIALANKWIHISYALSLSFATSFHDTSPRFASHLRVHTPNRPALDAPVNIH